MGSHAQPAPAGKLSPCIARQPILTADESVIGYELFFRETQDERRFSSDAETATSATIDMLNLVGLGVLCDGRLAFINCTHQMLLADYFSLLPANEVVVEIQESVAPDEDAIAACQKLKLAGYSIALDNFVPGDKREALVPYADFIKVGVTKGVAAECAKLVARYGDGHCRMLAQRVETRQHLVTAS